MKMIDRSLKIINLITKLLIHSINFPIPKTTHPHSKTYIETINLQEYMFHTKSSRQKQWVKSNTVLEIAY